MHQIINAAYCIHYDDYDFLLDVVRSVREASTGVELAIYTDKPDFMAKQALQKARLSDVPLTFHGPFVDCEAASAPDSEERRHFLDCWRRAFDVYQEFGARSIVLHTHHMQNIPEADKDTLRGYATEAIQAVANMAVERKINLTVENVGVRTKSGVLFDQDQYLALFEQLPAEVGSLIDIGHAFINHWDVPHAPRTLGTRIHSFHLHNNNGSADSHRPMFEPGNYYTAEEMCELLLLTNRTAPNAEWILEYAPGEHISKELIMGDLRTLAALNCK